MTTYISAIISAAIISMAIYNATNDIVAAITEAASVNTKMCKEVR